MTLSSGPAKGDDEGDQVCLDYTTKQLEDLQKQYQAVASEAITYMVKEGKWVTGEDPPPGVPIPTHLLSVGEIEEHFVGVPMSWKCCDHMDVVLDSQDNLKPSKVSGLQLMQV